MEIYRKIIQWVRGINLHVSKHSLSHSRSNSREITSNAFLSWTRLNLPNFKLSAAGMFQDQRAPFLPGYSRKPLQYLTEPSSAAAAGTLNRHPALQRTIFASKVNANCLLRLFAKNRLVSSSTFRGMFIPECHSHGDRCCLSKSCVERSIRVVRKLFKRGRYVLNLQINWYVLDAVRYAFQKKGNDKW